MGRNWLHPLTTILTVAKNWVSNLGKLTIYSISHSTTMYIYSSLAAWITLYSFPISS
jgi:hypothetical protein